MRNYCWPGEKTQVPASDTVYKTRHRHVVSWGKQSNPGGTKSPLGAGLWGGGREEERQVPSAGSGPLGRRVDDMAVYSESVMLGIPSSVSVVSDDKSLGRRAKEENCCSKVGAMVEGASCGSSIWERTLAGSLKVRGSDLFSTTYQPVNCHLSGPAQWSLLLAKAKFEMDLSRHL